METLAVKLPQSGHYIVAVSGGVDSVALLHLLVHQPKQSLRLRIAHINHGLRPTAGRDERLVRDLAQTYHLPIDVVKLDLGQASEAEARRRRYDALFDIMTRHQARAIITAHHADDRAETGIINSLRGSQRRGQAATFERSRLVRPLLELHKDQLQRYAQDQGLVWFEDETNQDTSIARNYIRRYWLSDPSTTEAVNSLQAALEVVNQRIDRRLAQTYYQFYSDGRLELPRRFVAVEPWDQLAALLHYCFRQLEPDREFSRRQIGEAARFSKTAQTGAQFRLSSSLKLLVGYDTVAIVLGAGSTEEPIINVQLVPQTSLSFGRWRLSFGTYHQAGASSLTVPPGSYQVRTVHRGDRVRTTAGTKKLQDLMVDLKVPQALRAGWPVVVDQSDQILWLPKLFAHPDLQKSVVGFRLIAEEG